jgi:CRP/FNR family transcriptional regulator
MGHLEKNTCDNCTEICDLARNIESGQSSNFLRAVSRVQYKRKETIVKQSSHSSHIIYLKSGLVKIFTERRNEKNIILKLVTPKNFLDLSQLSSDNYNFSVVALKDSEVCLIPKDTFYKLVSHNSDLARVVFEDHSKLLTFLIDKISSLGTKQMHGKLADIILYLCSKEFKEIEVFNSITRRDIAEMSGMSSESAIRLLTEFKNDGLIKVEGKKIEINNIELMHRLSDIG